MAIQSDYKRLTDYLGPERTLELAHTLLEIEGAEIPRDARRAIELLGRHDAEQVKSALRWLGIADGVFRISEGMLERDVAGKTAAHHPSAHRDWVPKIENEDPADVVARILSNEKVPNDWAGAIPSYQAAALDTIQRTFDNRYGNDVELKHFTGLAQAEIEKASRGSSFADDAFPRGDPLDVPGAQRDALRFVLLTLHRAPQGLRIAAIKKLGELGGVLDARFLLEHMIPNGGDDALYAERAARAIGSRVGWGEVVAAVRSSHGREKARALDLAKQLARMSGLAADLKRVIGGPHTTDMKFFFQREEWIDVRSGAGRAAIRERIESNLRDANPRMEPAELAREALRHFDRATKQAFTLKTIDDLPKHVLTSTLPHGERTMNGYEKEKKYLVTIDDDGAHFAPELTPMTSQRKHICHTNLTPPPKGAYVGLEVRFLGDRKTLVGSCSGRYGRDAAGYNAGIRYLQALGFEVIAITHGDFR